VPAAQATCASKNQNDLKTKFHHFRYRQRFSHEQRVPLEVSEPSKIDWKQARRRRTSGYFDQPQLMGRVAKRSLRVEHGL
jgi:hypothetical protein